MARQGYVYLLANRPNGTLYIGVTSDLARRVTVHKDDVLDGFSRRYAVHRLVWYEVHATILSAIVREKQLKKWRRAWKIELVEATNPTWEDLSSTIG